MTFIGLPSTFQPSSASAKQQSCLVVPKPTSFAEPEKCVLEQKKWCFFIKPQESSPILLVDMNHEMRFGAIFLWKFY